MNAIPVPPPVERPGDTPTQIDFPGFQLSGSESDSSAAAEPSQTSPEPATATEFDWLTEDCVVVEEQPPIAVYRNRRDHLIIRSRRDCDDEDGFVFVGTPEALKLLITALQRELRDWR
jgi:hypothetical protein